MFKFVIPSAFLLAASTGLATAQSATQIIPLAQKQVGSIITFGCPICKHNEEKTEGPDLARGSQILEVRSVEGKEKVYRTENWLGGSPVSFVHLPSDPENFDVASKNNGLSIIDGSENQIDNNSVASIDDSGDVKKDVAEAEILPVDQMIAGEKPKVASISEATVVPVNDEPVIEGLELRLD